jgi:hypothetical protein
MSLGDAAARERLLGGIDPARAGEHHDLLRRIFAAECADREAGRAGEHFENLYWCAYLLHLVGDPADAADMWAAKHLDFDTACGFDVEFLLGAGARRTLEHLEAHGHADIARHLTEYPELHDDLAGWKSFRHGYFYPDTVR